MDYNADFEDGYENTSMGAMHYMHHPGTESKIIFLHGLGSNVRAWSRLMQYLPGNLDIMLIDLLGHGKSDAPPEVQYTVSNQFQALREFIALKNNGDSFMFGHSYGGWIAAYYASQPLGSCKGLMLEDPAGLKDYFDGITDRDAYKESLFNTVMKAAGNRDYVIRSILDSDFAEDQLTNEMLSSINARTKIIWGSADQINDIKFADSFKSRIKASTLSVVEGAGHEPHFTNPKETSEIIMKFMQTEN